MNKNITINFGGLLQIVLVILKATGYIDWSWWIVFLPTLIGIGILFSIFMFIVLLFILAILQDMSK